LRSFHSRWQSEPERDIPRFCSCSSQSETVDPWSMVPSRLTLPDSYSSASTRDVFPTPRWPATAMFRIFVGSVAGMAGRVLLGRFEPHRIPAGKAGFGYSAAGAPAEAMCALRRRIALVWSCETRDSVTPSTSPISRRVSSS
jgi:hypothetical protein